MTGSPALPALKAALLLAQHGSFAAVARQLEMAPSTLSQQIRTLEDELGTRLFHRTTRSVHPTENGARFLKQLRPALEHLDSALHSVEAARDTPSGQLRLNSSYLANLLILGPCITGFLKRYPDIEVDVTTDDTLRDVVAGGFDAGFRRQRTVDADMVGVPVGPPQRQRMVASPSYLERRGTPKTPDDLLGHDCLRYRYPGSRKILPWRLLIDGHTVELEVKGPLVSTDSRLLRRAACDGGGLILQFESYLKEDLDSGALIPVLGEHLVSPERLFLYYPDRRHLPPKLRVFIDYLREIDQ